MRSIAPPRPRPSLGLAASWLLGLVAALGTVTAILARAIEPGNGPDGSSVVVGPPDRSIPVHPDPGDRVDTLPDLLSVSHAVETGSGWVALDARARRVHVLPDDPTAPLTAFGREGEGPGEMRLPYRVAVSESQVAVLEATGDRLVRFGTDGAVLGPVRLADPACSFGPAQALLAAPGGGFLVLRRCGAPDGSARAVLLGIDERGRVREVAERSLPSIRDHGAHPWASPVAAAAGSATFLGVLSEGCLVPVASDAAHPPARPLCVPAHPAVPLPDSIRSDLEVLADRVRGLGGSLTIPDELPAFTGVRTTSAGIVLEIPLPGGRTALDLLHDGGRRSRFLTDVPRGTFVGRRHLLVARDLLNGTELAWVPRHD